MKSIVTAAAAVMMLTATALADDPIELSDAEMDGATAGSTVTYGIFREGVAPLPDTASTSTSGADVARNNFFRVETGDMKTATTN